MNPVVYDWLIATVPPLLGVPFYESQGIMLQQTNLPDMWASIESANPTIERLCVGTPALYRESSVVTVVFLGKSGRGVRGLLVAAQAFADAFRDPGNYQYELVEENGIEGTLRWEAIGSPEPDPYEDGNWLTCSVSCIYTYDSVRGAAQVTP